MLLYGAEVWVQERLLETTEMRMLRWIKGVTLKDREKSDESRRDLGLENITLKRERRREKIVI